MDFALSTCWFGNRQPSGEALVDQALELGFDGLELGYALRAASVPGIQARLAAGAIAVESVHSYCPVPDDAPYGHPELYSLDNLDEDARKIAVAKMLETLAFASSVGAKSVVVHAGRVRKASRFWPFLLGRYADENTEDWLFRWRHKRMLKARAAFAARHLDALRRSLDALLPEFEKAGVRLAVENLPSYDAIPLPDEMDALLLEHGQSPAFAFWHDMGHGQVMENAGYIEHLATVRRFLPHIAGCHIHDVIGPVTDHQGPGEGGIDYAPFAAFAAPGITRVFEPSPAVAPEALKRGLALLRSAWNLPGKSGGAAAAKEAPAP